MQTFLKIALLRGSVSISALACAMFLATPARAEGYLIDGNFGIGSGLEGGDTGTGQFGWRRARLRITTGLDLRNDESQSTGFGFRAFAEIEKRATLGGEARYQFWLSHNVGTYGGLIGVVTPETLFGGSVGMDLVIPFGKRAGLFIEPSFSVLPVGSDLPSSGPLIWLLLSAGLKLGL
ncbi:MAG TPA: hypothetical protein VGC79_29905 [Polyangiaceae bacterium]